MTGQPMESFLLPLREKHVLSEVEGVRMRGIEMIGTPLSSPIKGEDGLRRASLLVDPRPSTAEQRNSSDAFIFRLGALEDESCRHAFSPANFLPSIFTRGFRRQDGVKYIDLDEQKVFDPTPAIQLIKDTLGEIGK